MLYITFFEQKWFTLSLFSPIVISICVAINNIKACHALHWHILAIELDIDIFTEVLEPLVEVPTPKHKCPNVDLENVITMLWFPTSKVLKKELRFWVSLLGFQALFINFSWICLVVMVLHFWTCRSMLLFFAR